MQHVPRVEGRHWAPTCSGLIRASAQCWNSDFNKGNPRKGGVIKLLAHCLQWILVSQNTGVLVLFDRKLWNWIYNMYIMGVQENFHENIVSFLREYWTVCWKYWMNPEYIEWFVDYIYWTPCSGFVLFILLQLVATSRMSCSDPG